MILILGGTTEGRAAVKVIDEAGKDYFYSTKGDEQEVLCKQGIRLTGGLDAKDMITFCRENKIRLLVDAAHPFATLLHQTVAEAAATLAIPVVRYERVYPPRSSDIVWCEDYADAVHQLEMAGITRLLALTGVQTIAKLRRFWTQNECWFRVLEREGSVALAVRQGFPAERLLFYHPAEPETDVLEQVRPQAILTKESGLSGGFQEKIEAARQKHIPIWAVKRPALPDSFIVVTGEYGLRKQIETLLPEFFPLRSGYTTGACATAAAKAALLALLLGEESQTVSFSLPNGERMELPVREIKIEKEAATATVVKDAGDDPDVTNGASIVVTVAWSDTAGISFRQGEGVGRVTLPGLGLDIGEPAINQTPRQMIRKELTALYKGGLEVTVGVPGGRELALRTFNPKLGIVDGISIIGTSGIVRPFSSDAFIEAIRREVEVCVAVGSSRLVINSGAKSERYVKRLYPDLPAQAFVHYGNFIGETLKIAAQLEVAAVSMGIMIGKAVKLAEGHLDTHSKHVTMNKEFLKQVALAAGCSSWAALVIDRITLARELWTELSMADASLFFPHLQKLCIQHCQPLVPQTELTILLINEEGNIPF